MALNSESGKPGDVRWWHPVPLLALIMLLSVLVLIGSSIFFDFGENDVLYRMAGRDYARGLITFLFAVVTIGTAVVLVVAALIDDGEAEELNRRLQRGKDILGLLLGVFGTIVGFYFGTELSTQSAARPVGELSVTEPYVTGDPAQLVAKVGGGVQPVRYVLEIGRGEIDEDEDDEREWPRILYGQVSENGWLDVPLPEDAFDEPGMPITLRVFDDANMVAVTEAEL